MPRESEPKNIYRQHLPNGLFFDLIHVKGGSYFFGDSDLEIILADFCIGQYPVTQALWQAVMGDNPAYFKGKNRPVESISWYNAAAFCNALNILIGYPPVYFQDNILQNQLNYQAVKQPFEFLKAKEVFHNPQNTGYRLPSETQWEYAARGGIKLSSYEYSGSDKLEEVGWFDENSHNETKPVGLKAPNELDIYDMSSNVWEWCEDQWHGSTNFRKLPRDGSAWLDREQSASRVNRGGSWSNFARFCRTTIRFNDSTPSSRSNIIGFRVVLFPPPAPKN